MPRNIVSFPWKRTARNSTAQSSAATAAGNRTLPSWVRKIYESSRKWVSSEPSSRSNSPTQQIASEGPSLNENHDEHPTPPDVESCSVDSEERSDRASRRDLVTHAPWVHAPVNVNDPVDDANDAETPVMLLPIGNRVFNIFRQLLDLASDGAASRTFQRHLIIESERFTLWAQDLGLRRQGHASLDYRVRDAGVMRSRLANLLTELGDHLDELRSLMAGERQPAELEYSQDDVKSSPSLSSRASSDNGSSSSAAEAGVKSSEDASSSSSFHEVEFRQRSVTEAINDLYSLATKMRNPRSRPYRGTQELFKRIRPDEREQYIREREELAAMVISYIQKQSLSQSLKRRDGGDAPSEHEAADLEHDYASPSNFLVKRIGIANTRRKQQFVYWKEHSARIRGSQDPPRADRPAEGKKGKEAPAEETFTATQSQMHSRAAPTMQLQSLATSVTKYEEATGIHTNNDGAQSVFSSSSRVSTVFTAHGTKIAWPLPPAHLTAEERPKFFTCP
ncbi:hypothetical protein OQA88_13187, partial [Cercophora sp. LCS_1]